MPVFESATQPYCLCCQKKIPKYTERVYVGSYGRLLHKYLHTKKECQELHNGTGGKETVISVRYVRPTWQGNVKIYPKGKYILDFSVWDGVSYINQYFCKATCAIGYAYEMADKGHRSPEYLDLVANLSRRGPRHL